MTKTPSFDHRDAFPSSADLHRRGFLVATLASGFAVAASPLMAQAISTDGTGLVAGEVQVPVAGGMMPAYRAHPAEGGPFPVVVVIQEIFGVHEHIRDICRRFAKLGYYAISGELYARQGDVAKMKDINEILDKVVHNVPDEQVWADLDSLVEYAGASSKGDTARLGVTGFCWGGRETWLYAARNPKVRAAVAWYGLLAPPMWNTKMMTVFEVTPTLKVPVLGLYAEKDKFIPLTDVDKMRAALAGSKSEIRVYPGTEHGFHADYRPSYNPEAAKDGWARAVAWFKANGVA